MSRDQDGNRITVPSSGQSTFLYGSEVIRRAYRTSGLCPSLPQRVLDKYLTPLSRMSDEYRVQSLSVSNDQPSHGIRGPVQCPPRVESSEERLDDTGSTLSITRVTSVGPLS